MDATPGGTRRILTALAVLLIGGGVVTAPASATATPETAPHTARAGADENDRLQAALDDVIATGVPGALAATDGDAGTWQGGSGVGNLWTKREPDPDGRFRIASISKPFTATLVLQLVDEGRIGLDDTVGEHLPGLLPYSEPITVRQLLQHTSGLPRDLPPHLTWETLPEIGTERFEAYTPERLVRASTDRPLRFQPGTSWAYSNVGYTVLAMLVEKVTGQRFEAALAERITGPLQLSDTASMRSFPFVPGAAGRAYERLHPAPVPRVDLTEYDYSRYIGAGSMVSTADDVNRFFDALLGGELLGPDMLREMTDTVPATTPDGAYAGYDYGLGIYRMSPGKGCGEAWGHDGSLPGSGTLSLHSPDGDAGMTLNVNQNMTAPPETAGAAFGVLTTALCGEDTQPRITSQAGPAMAVADQPPVPQPGGYARGHGNS